MNSNLIINNTYRKTFGIYDPQTNKRYDDIISSFLMTKQLSLNDIHNGTISPDRSLTKYILHVDNNAELAIKRHGILRCIISFQTRTTGKYAIARIPYAITHNNV